MSFTIRSITIRSITAGEAAALAPQLVMLLQHNVDDGASIGFLPPLSADEAGAYWQSVQDALAGPNRVMLVAEENTAENAGHLVGAVQLDLVAKTNAPHRAEVIKLMVEPSRRRQGIGRALMQAIEERARALGRTTLVLDTREGDPSEQLYQSLGYVRVGAIPQYVVNEKGGMDATVIYYKLL